MNRRGLFLHLGLAALAAGPWVVQRAAAQPAPPAIDATTRAEVLGAVVSALERRYVFPEVVPKVQAALADRERTRALDATASPVAFANELTTLLQAVTKDKHVRVRHSVLALPARADDAPPSAEERARFMTELQQRNFGVERVERLPGNIGLLELRAFAPAEFAGGAIAAAMTLLAHTDALIIDLRRNGGGDPNTVALLSSYLFEERTHLNNMYWREGAKTEQFWTQEWVPAPRFGGKKPIYVLTSGGTFSGAEEFSYNLRNLNRATLVGEVTGGGANPGGVHRLHAHYSMFVPTGRAISPVTGTNWEGTGVEPHLKVPADDALRSAQLKVLATFAAATTDAEKGKALHARIAELEKAAPAAR